MSKLKRVLAIHDLSCVGKCSLTEALPVISSAGIECSVLPTSILSTHTGGFKGYTFLDLTKEMSKIVEHFKSLNLDVDCFYTGYLGSIDQIDLIINIIKKLKKDDSLVFVDPVMADNGKMYPAFDINFAKAMVNLAKISDCLVPNLTEACFLLGIDYIGERKYSLEDVKDIAIKLSNLGPKYVVISGLEIYENRLGLLSYDKENNKFDYIDNKKEEGYFHGTGDLLASSILSCLLNGLALEKACKTSIKFVYNSVLSTIENKTDLKYGVDFEHNIFNFVKDILESKNE